MLVSMLTDIFKGLPNYHGQNTSLTNFQKFFFKCLSAAKAHTISFIVSVGIDVDIDIGIGSYILRYPSYFSTSSDKIGWLELCPYSLFSLNCIWVWFRNAFYLESFDFFFLPSPPREIG